MAWRIKELREKKHITQDELAERAKVCRATICRLESGKEFNAMNNTLSRLAKVLGVTVDELFFDDNA